MMEFLPPRAQLAHMLSRIYRQGLTTTSGGNLSIRDADSSLWITPAGIDKGGLTADDIIHVWADGRYEGPHKPSSEYPFHHMIYERRPDLKALVHAHPPSLVAFSIARKIPNTRINPQSQNICGDVGYAPYDLPGSAALGAKIADAFAAGHNAVMLENHGVVTGGRTLQEAFQRFETLEFCALINILAASLGAFRILTDEEMQPFHHTDHYLPEYAVDARTSRELEARAEIVAFVRRAYERRLMISTGGTVSSRLDEASFVITPYGFDRAGVRAEDLVLVNDLHREAGKVPSRAVRLHHAIYAAHPEIGCVMTAQPPNATTYAISARPFDTKTIPESYIVLRDLPVVPYGWQYEQPERIAGLISKQVPVVLLQNDAVLSTGATLLQAFDRLEVAEFTAQALLYSEHIGAHVPMDADALEALRQKFQL